MFYFSHFPFKSQPTPEKEEYFTEEKKHLLQLDTRLLKSVVFRRKQHFKEQRGTTVLIDDSFSILVTWNHPIQMT